MNKVSHPTFRKSESERMRKLLHIKNHMRSQLAMVSPEIAKR